MRNQKPTLSILIPVYNSEEFLRGCLQSVADQTIKDFEVIIVNDGSTDGSEMIIDEFVSQYPNMIKINQKNQGVAAARNTALDAASGEYIGFVDSDDFIDPVMYESLYQILTHNSVDIARCGLCYFLYPEYRLKGRAFYKPNGEKTIDSVEFVEKVMTLDAPGYVVTSLFKRDVFDDTRYPVDVHSDDIYTMWEIYLNAGKIAFTSESYYYYRRRALSNSSKETHDIEGYQDWILHLNHMKKVFEERNLYDRLSMPFHWYIMHRISMYTGSLRSNRHFSGLYGNQHPAFKLLNEQLRKDLATSDNLSKYQKSLFSSLHRSFRFFSIHERYYQYKVHKIGPFSFMGSIFKILLNDIDIQFAFLQKKKDASTNDPSEVSPDQTDHETQLIERYG